MADVSLSTMWMHKRFTQPRDFFNSGAELGFRSFELTSLATPRFYDEIHPGEYAIPSLHDPAPGELMPADLVHNDYIFTTLDDERRSVAVATAKRSVDIAVRYGARVVILHAGYSEANRDAERHLERLYREGQIASTAADALRARLALERMVNYDDHMSALRRSLDELIPYASARGVCLGIENRRCHFEIPNFDEMKWLLAYYQDSAVGYWHDVGHAETLARIGMTPHADWLSTFGSRLAGIHLHDVVEFKDHQTPGCGVVDWIGLHQLVPDHGLRTVEVHHDATPEVVQAGLNHLIATGWVRA